MLAPTLLLAFASLPAADSVTEVSRGSGLHRACQAEVRLMELPSLTKATQSDLLNGSYCVGYVNGFVANLVPTAGVCTNAAPIGEVVRTYVSFMEKNPELLGKDRRIGISLALREAYPCPLDPAPTPSATPPTQTLL